ncbi:hypothetical protein DRQ25_00760, partial [Candidatus Fermentibacteria bacterium]
MALDHSGCCCSHFPHYGNSQTKGDEVRILFAASEAYPFASTGGLAGVTGSLPKALCDAGHDVSIIMPLYQDVEKAGNFKWVSGEFLTSAGESFG